MKYLILALSMMTAVAFAGDVRDLKVGETFTIDSKIMGEERQIYVFLPQGYENRPDARYPVLYMTDAPGHMNHTGGTVEFLVNNGRMPAMIVVGVANTDRTRDLTPTPNKENPQSTAGGGNRFLSFFTDELAPKIEKRYRTLPYKIFSGHSFGGLFAINAFLENPDAFDAYIAVSPSLWWDNEIMVTKAKNFFKKRKNLEKTLYLTLGEEGDRMEVPFNHFTKVLKKKSPKGFVWDSKIMRDEDHGSVVLRSQYFGLKKIFEGWQPPRDATLDQFITHYKELSKRMKMDIPISEGRINQLGYNHLFSDNLDEALRIFEWNVKNNPGSANVYDSLGECLERKGELPKALANYKKALKMGTATNDPNLGYFQENVKRLSEKLEKSGT